MRKYGNLMHCQIVITHYGEKHCCFKYSGGHLYFGLLIHLEIQRQLMSLTSVTPYAFFF